MGKHLGDKRLKSPACCSSIIVFALHSWSSWQSGHSWSGDLDVYRVTLAVAVVVNAVGALLGWWHCFILFCLVWLGVFCLWGFFLLLLFGFYLFFPFLNTLNVSESEHLWGSSCLFLIEPNFSRTLSLLSIRAALMTVQEEDFLGYASTNKKDSKIPLMRGDQVVDSYS